MPWREATEMDQRKEFVRLALKRGSIVKALSVEFGISYTLEKELLGRFREEGLQGVSAFAPPPQ